MWRYLNPPGQEFRPTQTPRWKWALMILTVNMRKTGDEGHEGRTQHRNVEERHAEVKVLFANIITSSAEGSAQPCKPSILPIWKRLFLNAYSCISTPG